MLDKTNVSGNGDIFNYSIIITMKIIIFCLETPE